MEDDNVVYAGDGRYVNVVDVSWLGDLFMVAGWVDGCGG
jgi:hypothetical protein